ncbi:hypothetical protein GCM10008940_05930 [Microbulbifer agarilyticus]
MKGVCGPRDPGTKQAILSIEDGCAAFTATAIDANKEYVPAVSQSNHLTGP